MNPAKISCKSHGDLQTEVKHSLSESLISTVAPKDNDGNGKDFAQTDL